MDKQKCNFVNKRVYTERFIVLFVTVTWHRLALPLSCVVLLFQEVWGRSFCRTIEKLVEVVHEYPTEVEHIYSPSCVPLVRCAGCCGDENLECHPTKTTNVTMQVGRTRASCGVILKAAAGWLEKPEWADQIKGEKCFLRVQRFEERT